MEPHGDIGAVDAEAISVEGVIERRSDGVIGIGLDIIDPGEMQKPNTGRRNAPAFGHGRLGVSVQRFLERSPLTTCSMKSHTGGSSHLS